MTDALAIREKELLDSCERTIARGLQTFVDVGKALAAIRDRALYRETHDTFEMYCQDRWHLKRQRAYELMQAASVVSEISDNPPTTESHAAELARVPEEDRALVWQQAQERTNGKPTAAAIREVREERYQDVPGAQDVPPASDAVERPTNPAPSVPTRDLGDVLEERMPGTRADLARTSLRARWSKDMAAVADIDLLDLDELRGLIDDSEANVAIGTLRRVANRLENAGRPGLRLVGGNQ